MISENVVKLQYFPMAWLTARIMPTLKPGKPNNETGSYRPINLLCRIGKLFETITKKKYSIIMENRNIVL